MKQLKQMGNNDLVKLLQQDRQPFPVLSAPMATSYKITIDDVFTDTYQFDELVEVLETAGPEDCVQIKLNTPGGALHSIIPLLAAMKHTEAYTHVHVTSDTASAGTLLMMVADSVFINEYSSLMFHNASYGYMGHAGNMEAHVNFSTKALKKVMGDLYKDFLMPDEISRLQDGLEFYLTAEEAHDRFKKRDAIRKEESEVENNEKEKLSEEEGLKLLTDITAELDKRAGPKYPL